MPVLCSNLKKPFPRDRNLTGILQSCSCRAGFTLIEVLVSMVILSVSLTVIMGIFSSGLKSKRAAQEYTIAVAQADNIMSSILMTSESLEPGTQTGEFEDGSRWEAQIIKWEGRDNTGWYSFDDNGLLKIAVTITWTAGTKKKTYILETITKK